MAAYQEIMKQYFLAFMSTLTKRTQGTSFLKLIIWKISRVEKLSPNLSKYSIRRYLEKLHFYIEIRTRKGTVWRTHTLSIREAKIHASFLLPQPCDLFNGFNKFDSNLAHRRSQRFFRRFSKAVTFRTKYASAAHHLNEILVSWLTLGKIRVS